MAARFSSFVNKEAKNEKIPCPMQKIRNLEEKPNLLNAAESVSSKSDGSRATDPSGLFGLLPTEIFCILLKYLNVQAIGNLSLTSTKMRDRVLDWIFSRFLRAKLPSALIFSRNARFPTDGFRAVIVMFKRATLAFSTVKRMYYLEKFMAHIERLINARTKFSAKDVLQIRGVILQNYVVAWEISECLKLYDLLNYRYDFEGQMRTFLTAWDPKSSDARSQVKLQSELRNLLLDRCNNKHITGFWLDLAIKKLDLREKAAILVLLYSPLSYTTGKIKWSWVTDCVNECSYNDYYSTFAEVILCFFTANAAWHMSKKVQLLFEITGYPEKWGADSVVALLLEIRKQDRVLVSNFLVGAMEQPSQHSATELWTEILLVACRVSIVLDGEDDASIFMSVLRNVCRGFDQQRRALFLQKLWYDVHSSIEQKISTIKESLRGSYEEHELRIIRKFLEGSKLFSGGVLNLSV